MAEIEDRVSKLERTFARLTGGATVAAAVLLAFIGVTHFLHIPQKVEEAFQGYLDDHPEIQRQLDEFLNSASGSSQRAEQAAGGLNSLLEQFRSGVIDSGTIAPADWERFESGKTYGVRADVSVDLSGIQLQTALAGPNKGHPGKAPCSLPAHPQRA